MTTSARKAEHPDDPHMAKSRFSQREILAILDETGRGQTVADVCGAHGISTATYYRWRSGFRPGAALGALEPRKKPQLQRDITSELLRGSWQLAKIIAVLEPKKSRAKR